MTSIIGQGKIRAACIGLLALTSACADEVGSAGAGSILSSDQTIIAERRMTPEQLRQMTGVDRLPAPADQNAFSANLGKHYPPELRGSGASGSALLDVGIDEHGAVVSVEVVKRPAGVHTTLILKSKDGSERRVIPNDHPAFGVAARGALRDARFTPAMRDGQPVPYTMRMTINFEPPSGQP